MVFKLACMGQMRQEETIRHWVLCLSWDSTNYTAYARHPVSQCQGDTAQVPVAGVWEERVPTGLCSFLSADRQPFMISHESWLLVEAGCDSAPILLVNQTW